MGAGLPAIRQRTAATIPRVTCPSGEKVVVVVPFMIPPSDTAATASAYHAPEGTSVKAAAAAWPVTAAVRPSASISAQIFRFISTHLLFDPLRSSQATFYGMVVSNL